MANEGRALPSVELAKLNQPTMREINSMVMLLEQVTAFAQALEKGEGISPPQGLERAYGGALQRARGMAAETVRASAAAREALTKLKVELSK